MRSSNVAVWLAGGSLLSLVSAQLEAVNNATYPLSSYFTRPQSLAPALNITQSGTITPGYLFISPYQHPGAGAYIYDKFGNLVWDGFGTVGSANAHDFKTCTYNGTGHLCVTQVNQRDGYGQGYGLIIDTNYNVVRTVQVGNDATTSDMHEFQLLDDGKGGNTALLTSYKAVPFDLTRWNITNGLGWLMDCIFQEVDVRTGEVLFEWYASNHVDQSTSIVLPDSSDISGSGLNSSSPWDYFHMNSVDKSASGNYLVSARHTATVYYVNGTDRTVIWKLSSESASDFKCDGFTFGYQHDARIQSETPDNMTISVFDNASNCYKQTSPESSGRVIVIDFNTRTATEQSRTTFNNVSSCSQGNTQILDDSGTFHGWGDKAWFSEHNSTGDVVMSGTYLADPSVVTAMNYRAFSDDWESTPANTKPAVYSYAYDTNSSNQIYVSWNGATTVAKWRYRAADRIGDEFVLIGETPRVGFETAWTAPGYHLWVMVEAVAADGTGLRNSSFQPTFVPSSSLVTSCDATGCNVAT